MSPVIDVIMIILFILFMVFVFGGYHKTKSAQREEKRNNKASKELEDNNS